MTMIMTIMMTTMTMMNISAAKLCARHVLHRVHKTTVCSGTRGLKYTHLKCSAVDINEKFCIID